MVKFCDLGSRSVRFHYGPSTRVLSGTQLILCSPPAYLAPGEVFWEQVGDLVPWGLI